MQKDTIKFAIFIGAIISSYGFLSAKSFFNNTADEVTVYFQYIGRRATGTPSPQFTGYGLKSKEKVSDTSEVIKSKGYYLVKVVSKDGAILGQFKPNMTGENIVLDTSAGVLDLKVGDKIYEPIMKRPVTSKYD